MVCKNCGKEYKLSAYNEAFDDGVCLDCETREREIIYKYREG